VVLNDSQDEIEFCLPDRCERNVTISNDLAFYYVTELTTAMSPLMRFVQGRKVCGENGI
jgi:hypothetical protein